MDAPPILSPVEAELPPVAPWRTGFALILLLWFPPALGLLGYARGETLPSETMLPATVLELLWVSAQNLVIFAVLAVVVTGVGRLTWRSVFARAGCGWKAWALGLGYSVLFRFLLGGVMALVVMGKWLYAWWQGRTLDSLAGLRPQIENLLDPAALRDPMYLLITTTLVSFIVAGLREELWRAAVFAGLSRWRKGWMETGRGRIGAALLAAFSFGLGHLPQGLSGVWMTGILGFFLGLVMLWHRSLWVAVLAHGFFNAASFLMLRMIDEAGLLEQFLGTPPTN